MGSEFARFFATMSGNYRCLIGAFRVNRAGRGPGCLTGSSRLPHRTDVAGAEVRKDAGTPRASSPSVRTLSDRPRQCSGQCGAEARTQARPLAHACLWPALQRPTEQTSASARKSAGFPLAAGHRAGRRPRADGTCPPGWKQPPTASPHIFAFSGFSGGSRDAPGR